jgi:hypothetical protein
MFYDLKNVGLGDWHPRDIPKALLRSGVGAPIDGVHYFQLMASSHSD